MRVLRWVIVLLALAVVLVLLAGELIARPLAEEAVGRDVQRHYDLDQQPEVDLNGFPFLVRVALGRLPSAEGRLSHSVVGGLRLAEAQLRFRNVRFDPARLADSDGRVTAEGGTARVTVTDGDFSAFLADQGLDGRVRFGVGTVEYTDQFTVSGVVADVTAAGVLAVDDEHLSFEPTQLSAAGLEVDASVLEPLLDQLAFTVELPRVAGVQLSRLSVEEGRVTLAADIAEHLLTG